MTVDISKGVALLDEKRPGWEHEVVLRELVMASECNCVLGHVYGHFESGLKELGIDEDAIDEAVECGFAIDEGDGGWDALDDAWRAEIKARTAKP